MIIDGVNNHVTSQLVHDLTINTTIMKLLFIWKIFCPISIYWVIVIVQLEVYLKIQM